VVDHAVSYHALGPRLATLKLRAYARGFMPSPRPLGDAHNFGRRVALRGDFVEKPRPVRWEQLLLNAKSPLRRLLATAAERAGLGADAFDFLPSLRFVRPNSRTGARVERIELAPLGRLNRAEKAELARVAGRSLALFSWLGVADLHWENLVLGAGERGRIVFAPLDIEMILDDFESPTETKLIPAADPEYAAMNRHAAGLRRLLPYLGKPLPGALLLTMAAAYLRTLSLLDEAARDIAAMLESVAHFRTTPIRVCLRGTDEYVRAASVPPWPPLLAAETEQLARGDIPYFFRLYGERGIRYYDRRALTHSVTLPARGDVPRLEPLLSTARALRSARRRRLREEGLFALLGAFDHAGLTGRTVSQGLGATFTARRITVTLPSGAELTSRRDLGVFVGSLYLRCRCGEVRTPFVPPVTRCTGGL
jgi:hypothetical protein